MTERRFWFDDLFGSLLPGADTPMDVVETEEGFEITVDLPGVEPGDIDVSVSGDKLSIKAERKWAKPKGKAAFHRSFSEVFTLSRTVDADGISAKCVNGVLRVTVPKRRKAEPSARRIEIGT